MVNLIRNTAPTSTNLVRAPEPRQTKVAEPTPALDKVAYHIQAAMQEMRDDPPGTLEFEQHCGAIYHHLYNALNLLVAGPPKPPSCLQSDLDDVLGGRADGTTEVPQVQVESSAPK